MAGRELERIRNAILDHHYSLTEHAYNEMRDDDLDVLDVESDTHRRNRPGIDHGPTRDALCCHGERH